MTFNLRLLSAVLILGVGAQAFAYYSPGFRARAKVGEAAYRRSPRLPSFSTSEETRVRMTMEEKVSDLIATKNFIGLEELALSLRRSKIETASGVWYLSAFYHVLSFEWPDSADLPEREWMNRQLFLRQWRETNPTSITARVALARFWKNYAWKARGTGLSNTVPLSAWELFDARLKKATQILVDARKLRAKCPVWWDTMQFVALGRSCNRAEYDKIYDEAVRFDPQYSQFYINKAIYLTTRWYGIEGDWQKFATDAADRVGGNAGDILYARIGWRIHQGGYYSGFLRDSGYSWARMKNGLQQITTQNPASLTAASELAFLAYQAEDRECAKPMFNRIAMNVDGGIWQDGASRFIRARTWAMMN